MLVNHARKVVSTRDRREKSLNRLSGVLQRFLRVNDSSVEEEREEEDEAEGGQAGAAARCTARRAEKLDLLVWG